MGLCTYQNTALPPPDCPGTCSLGTAPGFIAIWLGMPPAHVVRAPGCLGTAPSFTPIRPPHLASLPSGLDSPGTRSHRRTWPRPPKSAPGTLKAAELKNIGKQNGTWPTRDAGVPRDSEILANKAGLCKRDVLVAFFDTVSVVWNEC